MKCPFWDLISEITDSCVYSDGDVTYCRDVETCPGNSDAWCRSVIEWVEMQIDVNVSYKKDMTIE